MLGRGCFALGVVPNTCTVQFVKGVVRNCFAFEGNFALVQVWGCGFFDFGVFFVGGDGGTAGAASFARSIVPTGTDLSGR